MVVCSLRYGPKSESRQSLAPVPWLMQSETESSDTGTISTLFSTGSPPPPPQLATHSAHATTDVRRASMFVLYTPAGRETVRRIESWTEGRVDACRRGCVPGGVALFLGRSSAGTHSGR